MASFNMTGIDRLTHSIEVWAKDVEHQVVADMEEVSFEAANNVRRMITDAHTRTGLDREAAGEGEPGRVRRGDFRADVIHSVTREGNTVVATWGWEHPPDYYLYQEEGTRFIAGVDSLQTTLEIAANDMGARLARL